MVGKIEHHNPHNASRLKANVIPVASFGAFTKQPVRQLLIDAGTLAATDGVRLPLRS